MLANQIAQVSFTPSSHRINLLQNTLNKYGSEKVNISYLDSSFVNHESWHRSNIVLLKVRKYKKRK